MASIVSNFNTSGLTVGNTIIDSTGVISAPSITITGTTTPGPTSLVSKSYVDAITPAFTSITGKPTTLSGYGITDSVTAVAADLRYAPLGGAGTSGTWPIGISGNSATVTTLNPTQIFSAINNQSNPDWYRTVGNNGWYNSTYGVGIYSTSAGLVQTYNNASLQVNGALTVTGRAIVINAVNANEAVALGQFPASLAAAGYQKLPGGLIMQWGLTGAIAASAATTFNFPIQFPTAAVFAVQIPVTLYVVGQASPTISSLLTTSCGGFNETSNTNTFYTFAIGY